MKKFYSFIGLNILLFIALTGCLYPQNELSKNKVPNEAQLDMVQTAVTEYKKETNGLVPIKTKENDVDQYQKYLIDFSLLKEHQLIAELPATAYENGGIYQYTIITPEEDPKVKLIDLRLSETIREINTKIAMYRSENVYPPFGDKITDGVYKINYENLGYTSEPVVVSPYSQENLPIVLNNNGDVFIDYRIDLKKALDQYDHSFTKGEDIRPILANHFPFVPVYSLPYTIKDNEPAFLIE